MTIIIGNALALACLAIIVPMAAAFIADRNVRARKNPNEPTEQRDK